MKHIISVAAAFILLLVSIGIYTFLLFQVDGYVMRMSSALRASESLTQRDATARSIEKFLNETNTERSALASYIVGKDDVVSVIELLENSARASRVALSISSVSVTDGGWQYHERIQVQFSVDGTFSNITDYVATLEALPYVVRIEQGTLGASADDNWFGSFVVSFVKDKS